MSLLRADTRKCTSSRFPVKTPWVNWPPKRLVKWPPPRESTDPPQVGLMPRCVSWLTWRPSSGALGEHREQGMTARLRPMSVVGSVDQGGQLTPNFTSRSEVWPMIFWGGGGCMFFGNKHYFSFQANNVRKPNCLYQQYLKSCFNHPLMSWLDFLHPLSLACKIHRTKA